MILRHAFRSLGRNRVRSIVTLLGVASLLFLVSLLVAILGGFAQANHTDGSERRLITSHEVSLTFPLPVSYWEKIRAVPHVVEVCPQSWFGGKYNGLDDPNLFFARFFVDPDSLLRVLTEIQVPPDQAQAWKEDRQGALVSDKLAKRFGWKLGDRMTLVGDIYPMTAELNVRAIYTGGEEALYFQHAYVDETLGRPGIVGTYTILLDDPANLSAVAEGVDHLFADSDAATKTQTEKAFQAGFASMMGNVVGLVTRLSLVIGLTILITAANTMAMAVRERTTEIAVLRAIGFPPGRVLRLILTESVLLSALAALVGIGGFALLTWFIFVVRELHIPGLWFPLLLPPRMGLILAASALGVGVIAGLVPGLLAARRPVVDGLRRA
jgi:putative ABC transport system permease protein